ncbi:Cro/CI family transcriptional regulator [Secundilactobacillus silagincola]|uniref:Cro/CI family transcriptional regulator n=1 Tax=Secundilactobacillus silagincola TaxID=1714681 RepID=A0A1Z5J1I4_9LACO|nr:helix-turn-helix transcriptional regulator [Secundilactobacillus silagincola]GAX07893.1 Cro/CI family transcriptional regulator [Secundilactobacillus silagincola]
MRYINIEREVVTTNIHNQIKLNRERLGLTQDELASKLYVSRQTISNWETAHSYPDLENLLRLSVLFDVSLDDLLKGDVAVMKHELNYARTNKWAWLMTVMLGLSALSIGPSVKFWGWWGLVLPVLLINISLYAGIKIERWKGQHQLKTYSEIVAFEKNKVIDENERLRNTIKDQVVLVVTMLLFMIGAGGLALLGFWLVK